MRISRKITMLGCTLMSTMLLVTGCGGSSTGTTTKTTSEKIKLTLMFAWPDDKIAAHEQEMVQAKFGDKYDITFKQVDNNVDKTIKTTISAGNPVDLAFYWTNTMDTFVNANMALDLTPYLEADNGKWKNSFIDGALNQATINGKVYAVPATPVYAMMLANKDLLDQAGVKLSDTPSWDEFVNALATIKEKLNITPLGASWPNWIIRNNIVSIWPDEQKVKDFESGQISFKDPNVVKAMDAAKMIYDKGYAYPDKGALTVTLDQVKAAFKNKQVAIIEMVNFLASGAVKDAGIQNVQVLSMPHMGPSTKIQGTGANGYMIPANVKHPDASVEILKYLTSAECLQYRADQGSPVAIKGIEYKDPKVKEYARDLSNCYPYKEITTLSPEIDDMFNNKLPANYIFKPQETLNQLEELRLKAIKK